MLILDRSAEIVLPLFSLNLKTNTFTLCTSRNFHSGVHCLTTIKTQTTNNLHADAILGTRLVMRMRWVLWKESWVIFCVKITRQRIDFLLKFACDTDLRPITLVAWSINSNILCCKTSQKCKLCEQCFFRKIDENYACDDELSPKLC